MQENWSPLASKPPKPEAQRDNVNDGVAAADRPMRGLKSFKCATRLIPALDALQSGGRWLAARQDSSAVGRFFGSLKAFIVGTLDIETHDK